MNNFINQIDSLLIPFNKKGNKIQIKPENKGKFTKYCKGKVTQECISKGKNSKDPKIRKRATFAANARKWAKKHQEGGELNLNIKKFNKGGKSNSLQYLINPEMKLIESAYNFGKDKLKDITYSIMNMGAVDKSTRGTTRNAKDIMNAIANNSTWSSKEQRASIPRNVASLYIYGNDLGQYTERPDLRYVGVEYDKTLRENGRNPDKIKTYEGQIINNTDFNDLQVSLPNFISDSQLIDYSNSDLNQIYGHVKPNSASGDDVAGFVSRLSVVDGKPVMVHSDLYDFDKGYANRFGKNKIGIKHTAEEDLVDDPYLDLKAEALNKVGTPFILKQVSPIKRIADDKYMISNYIEEDILTKLGYHHYLPELEVTAQAPNKKLIKKKKGGSLKKFSGGNILKDAAYSIMAGGKKKSASWGQDRDASDIAEGILNMSENVENRGNIPRNLSSLYIYGNDQGQFEESPELKNVGVEYDKYLTQHGRNPEDVKTYKGEIVDYNDYDGYSNDSESVVLPYIDDNSKQNIINYINSPYNRTFDREKDFGKGDDVAGYLTRLSIYDGNPVAVHSDLWDFGAGYSEKYGTAKWKAKALDMVGNPFILKQITPILQEDISTWSPKNNLEEEVGRQLGILPELNVTAKRLDRNTKLVWED